MPRADYYERLQRQEDLRIRAFAVAKQFYDPHESGDLERFYLPPAKFGPGDRWAQTQGIIPHTHNIFFENQQEAQLKRGLLVRQRIERKLQENGSLYQISDTLEETLRRALQLATQRNEEVYINVGLLRAPELEAEYRKAGWKKGIKWANFRPALLKLWWVNGGKEAVLQVIEIKSSTPDAPKIVSPFIAVQSDHNGLLTSLRSTLTLMQADPVNLVQAYLYHYFLGKRVPSLVGQYNGLQFNDPLRQLRMSSTVAVWSYHGCIATGCNKHACFLNKNLQTDVLNDLMFAGSAKANVALAEKIVLSRVPHELDAVRKDEEGPVVLSTGFAQLTI